MDRQEIRMRCLEAAQAATKTPATVAASVIVEWAAKFETFVVGPDDAPAAPKAAKAKAPKPEEPTP